MPKVAAQNYQGLTHGIPLAWVNVFGGMWTLTLDGDTSMRGKEADDWVAYSQITLKHETPHQKAWLIDRHNAIIGAAVQRTESQIINKNLRINSQTV